MKFKIKPNDFVSFYINSSRLIIERALADRLSVPLESRAIAVGSNSDGDAISIFVEPVDINPSDPFWYLCESYLLKPRAKSSNGKILLSEDIDVFNDKQVIHLGPQYIAGVRVKIDSVTDFCKCDSCENIVHMAAPNQPDGKTFICYSCRQNPIRKYY